MENHFSEQSDQVDLNDYWIDGMKITDFRDWLNAKIEQGFKTASVNVPWGYYNDIDAIDFKVKK